MAAQTRSSHPSPKALIIAWLGNLAAEPDVLRASLAKLNDLPVADFVNLIGEAEALYQSRLDCFTSAEQIAIEAFLSFADRLPPEPDDFWSGESYDGPLWQETREQTRALLRALAD